MKALSRKCTAFLLSLTLLLPLALSRAIAQRYPGCELTVAYIDSYGDSVGASWIAD